MRRTAQRDVAAPRPIAPPAKTPEERESQLSAYAYDLAEKQMLDGSASAQVITHFLKASSTREKLEQERLRRENILLSARAEAMETAKRMEVLYEEAIKAMRSYAGQPELEGGDRLDDAEDSY